MDAFEELGAVLNFVNKTHPYRKGEERLFLVALKQLVNYHYVNNDDYQRILDDLDFNPTYDDIDYITKLPPLTADLFKKNQIFTGRLDSLSKVTSSGTGRIKTKAYYDDFTLKCAQRTIVKLLKQHRLISLIPSRYIVLGYAPTVGNTHGSIRVQREFMKLSPSIAKAYALEYNNGNYTLVIDKLVQTIKKWCKGKYPVRLIGYPSLLNELLEALNRDNIVCQLPKNSLVLTGGGWKGFGDKPLVSSVLRKKTAHLLGIPPSRIIDLYSAVEMPALFIECKYHHMHVPNYFKVVIRDVSNFKPLEYGEVGLINVISPLVSSMPVHSIVMSDLGVLKNKPCPCGVQAPYLKVLGRTKLLTTEGCAKQVIESAN